MLRISYRTTYVRSSTPSLASLVEGQGRACCHSKWFAQQLEIDRGSDYHSGYRDTITLGS